MIQVKGPPGIISQATQLQAEGTYFAANLMRWRNGFAEKMGGWKRLQDLAFNGIIRRLWAWEDLDTRRNLMVATDLGLQILINDVTYSLGREVPILGGKDPGGTLLEGCNFQVTAGSKVVTYSYNIRGDVSQGFIFRNKISIGGRIIPAGTLARVETLTGTTGFTFTMANAALYSEGPVHGTPFFTNDIANGLTCTFRNHGLVVGSTFTFDQRTSFTDSTLGSGVSFDIPGGTVVAVKTVPTVDTFTFDLGSFGTGLSTGAVVYEGWVVNRQLGGPPLYSPIAIDVVIGMSSREVIGDPQLQTWFLDNLGQDGLSLLSGGPLEVYKPPISNGTFTRVVGLGPPVTAPQKNNGMVATGMPQAQVVLFGTEGHLGQGDVDPLLVRWSDVGTYDQYLPTVSNQAGSFRLSRGSRIVGAIQAPQATLIWTDTDLWAMNYIGPPLIYGFAMIASGCGLEAPHDVAVLGRSVYWRSLKNIWRYGDGGVQIVPCSVWDYIFEDLDDTNLNKCHAGSNSTTNEITFWFPSKSQGIPANVNLLTNSEDFDQNNRWLLTNASCPKFGSGPPPLAPSVLTEFNVNGYHMMQQRLFKDTLHKTYTLSIYIALNPNHARRLLLQAQTSAGSVFALYNITGASPSVLNLATSNPSVFVPGAAHILTDSIATGPSGNGWMRADVSFTSDDSSYLDIYVNMVSGTDLVYLGTDFNVDPTSLTLAGAMLNAGSSVLPYDKTGPVLFQNETTHYVKFAPQEPAWDSGVLWRSAWLDHSVFQEPMGGDANFRIQQHEIGYDDDDQPMRNVYVETGYAQMSNGSLIVSADHVQPDFKWFGKNGAVDISFRTRMYPSGKVRNYGPYRATATKKYFTPRIRGRMLAVRYDWAPIMGFSARVGVTQVRVKPAGSRP